MKDRLYKDSSRPDRSEGEGWYRPEKDESQTAILGGALIVGAVLGMLGFALLLVVTSVVMGVFAAGYYDAGAKRPFLSTNVRFVGIGYVLGTVLSLPDTPASTFAVAWAILAWGCLEMLAQILK